MSDRVLRTSTDRLAIVGPLERLEAIEAIRRLKARYCRHVDCGEWDEFESLFLPDAPVEYQARPFASPAEMVQFFREMLVGGTTVHEVHQSEIDVHDADSATGVWSFSDRVQLADGHPVESWKGHGRYWETYRRVNGEWLIASLRTERLVRLPL